MPPCFNYLKNLGINKTGRNNNEFILFDNNLPQAIITENNLCFINNESDKNYQQNAWHRNRLKKGRIRSIFLRKNQVQQQIIDLSIFKYINLNTFKIKG